MLHIFSPGLHQPDGELHAEEGSQYLSCTKPRILESGSIIMVIFLRPMQSNQWASNPTLCTAPSKLEIHPEYTPDYVGTIMDDSIGYAMSKLIQFVALVPGFLYQSMLMAMDPWLSLAVTSCTMVKEQVRVE